MQRVGISRAVHLNSLVGWLVGRLDGWLACLRGSSGSGWVGVRGFSLDGSPPPPHSDCEQTGCTQCRSNPAAMHLPKSFTPLGYVCRYVV